MRRALSPGKLPRGWSIRARDGPLDQLLWVWQGCLSAKPAGGTAGLRAKPGEGEGEKRTGRHLNGGRSLQSAPSGRAGVRLGGLTWGVCCGPRRREAPCGKRPEPMCRKGALGVPPSTCSPDPRSIGRGREKRQYPKLSESNNWYLQAQSAPRPPPGRPNRLDAWSNPELGRREGRRQRRAVKDVLLGDLDLIEAEGAHHLDQDHGPRDDRRRPAWMQAWHSQALCQG